MPDITCARCGQTREGLSAPPFPNEFGARILASICQQCWKDWLKQQTQIINHYGLDLSNPDAQTFLFDNMKGYLFNEALPTAEIDTTKEGTIKW